MGDPANRRMGDPTNRWSRIVYDTLQNGQIGPRHLCLGWLSDDSHQPEKQEEFREENNDNCGSEKIMYELEDEVRHAEWDEYKGCIKYLRTREKL